MRLYLETLSNNVDYDANICVAWVNLSQSDAKRIMRRHEEFVVLKAKDESIFKVTFTADDVLYLEDTYVGVDEIDMDGAWYVAADRNWSIGVRTDAEWMHIGEMGVCWSCVPKHTNIEVTTAQLDWDLIRKIAYGVHGQITKTMKKRKAS